MTFPLIGKMVRSRAITRLGGAGSQGVVVRERAEVNQQGDGPGMGSAEIHPSGSRSCQPAAGQRHAPFPEPRHDMLGSRPHKEPPAPRQLTAAACGAGAGMWADGSATAGRTFLSVPPTGRYAPRAGAARPPMAARSTPEEQLQQSRQSRHVPGAPASSAGQPPRNIPRSGHGQGDTPAAAMPHTTRVLTSTRKSGVSADASDATEQSASARLPSVPCRSGRLSARTAAAPSRRRRSTR